MRSTTFRKFAAGAALAMLAVLPACIARPPEGPPPQGSQGSTEQTTDGTVPPNQIRSPSAGCGGGLPAYVERGANQTVPKLKLVVEAPLVAGPVIATGTVPNQFGSRAVTSAAIVVSNPDIFGDQDREYHITWWCTPDIEKAWLVFG